MPYFSIETNQSLGDDARDALPRKMSALIAGMLGKPEPYVMTSLKTGTAMTFGGTPAPAAFVALKSIGLPEDRCSEFSEKICAFVEAELGVSPSRIFIDFAAIQGRLFGWNGKTF